MSTAALKFNQGRPRALLQNGVEYPTAISAPTFATARSLPAPIPELVMIDDRETKGDGGGGLFRFDSASSDPDDDGITLACASSATGRLKRQFSGPINVAWYGIRGNDNQANAPNNTTRLNALILSFAGGFGGHVYFPHGLYYFNDQILIDRIPSLRIEGAGMGTSTLWQYVGPDDATAAKAFVLVRRSPETYAQDIQIVARIDATHRMGKCVHVTSDGSIGVGESGPIHVIFQRCQISGGSDVAYQIGSDTDVDVNTDRCALIDCTCGGSNYGVRISNTNTNNFQMKGGAVESNTIAGIEIMSYPRGTFLDNVQMSGNSTPRRAVTFDHNTNTFTCANHGLRNNVTIELWDGTVPGGGNFTSALGAASGVDTQYFVINRTANTFQLSTAPNGAALTGTTNGSGLTFNSGADVLVRYTLGSGVEINGKQNEQSAYPYLKVEKLAQGSVVLRNMLASYSLPAVPVTADIYKIIDYRGDGFFELDNVQFYGPSTQIPGATAPVYVHPTANANAGAHVFVTKNVTLFEGAVYDVLRTGNGAMRWIDLGTTSHVTANDTAPSAPHHRLHEPLQYCCYGHILSPTLPGVTLTDDPLVSVKTLKYTFDKSAFVQNATAITLAFLTLGKFTRITKVLFDVTTAFAGVAGVTFEVGNTGGGGAAGTAAYLLANTVMGGLPIRRGLAVADLGAALTGGAAYPGGDIASFTGNAQMSVTLRGATALGSGAVTNLTTGSVDVYVTIEEMLP